jgi:hypothetical protein
VYADSIIAMRRGCDVFVAISFCRYAAPLLRYYRVLFFRDTTYKMKGMMMLLLCGRFAILGFVGPKEGSGLLTYQWGRS